MAQCSAVQCSAGKGWLFFFVCISFRQFLRRLPLSVDLGTSARTVLWGGGVSDVFYPSTTSDTACHMPYQTPSLVGGGTGYIPAQGQALAGVRDWRSKVQASVVLVFRASVALSRSSCALILCICSSSSKRRSTPWSSGTHECYYYGGPQYIRPNVVSKNS